MTTVRFATSRVVFIYKTIYNNIRKQSLSSLKSLLQKVKTLKFSKMVKALKDKPFKNAK